MEKISVLMPVYNEKIEYFSQAIESILAQTYENIEVLLIDDGSTSIPLMNSMTEYSNKYDKIKLFKLPHVGITNALNFGLEIASGEWIARHDSDDWSESDRLEKQHKIICEPGIVVVGSNARLHSENGRMLWDTKLPALFLTDSMVSMINGSPFIHGATMFSKETSMKIGGYNNKYSSAQDVDFFLRMCRMGKGINISKSLYHLRFSGSSISANKTYEQHLNGVTARIIIQHMVKGEKIDDEKANALAVKEVGEVDKFNCYCLDKILLAGRNRAFFSQAAILIISTNQWRVRIIVVSKVLRGIAFMLTHSKNLFRN